MGSIDFSANKHRDKKVAKVFKQTINGLSNTDSLVNKINRSALDMNKYKNNGNRTFLSEDLHNFFAKKNDEFARLNLPKSNDE